jgi:hypothetical protein
MKHLKLIGISLAITLGFDVILYIMAKILDHYLFIGPHVEVVTPFIILFTPLILALQLFLQYGWAVQKSKDDREWTSFIGTDKE